MRYTQIHVDSVFQNHNHVSLVATDSIVSFSFAGFLSWARETKRRTRSISHVAVVVLELGLVGEGDPAVAGREVIVVLAEHVPPRGQSAAALINQSWGWWSSQACFFFIVVGAVVVRQLLLTPFVRDSGGVSESVACI